MALSKLSQAARTKNLNLIKNISKSKGKAAGLAAVTLYNKVIDTAKSFLSAQIDRVVPLDKLDDIVSENFAKLPAASVLSTTSNVLSKIQGPIGSLGFLGGKSGDSSQLAKSMQSGISTLRKTYDKSKNEADRNDFAGNKTKALVKKLESSLAFLDQMKIQNEEV
jgi:hypothetical protein